MIALLQRVSRARVSVEGRDVGAIGRGLLVLVGCRREDGPAEADRLARRIAGYRVFEDAQGLTNLDVGQVQGQLLVVSQFTLAADTRKGRRPSFSQAGDPETARGLIERLCSRLREAGLVVAEGRFGAPMEVELVNQGPATYLLEAGSGAPDA